MAINATLPLRYGLFRKCKRRKGNEGHGEVISVSVTVFEGTVHTVH